MGGGHISKGTKLKLVIQENLNLAKLLFSEIFLELGWEKKKLTEFKITDF